VAVRPRRRRGAGRCRLGGLPLIETAKLADEAARGRVVVSGSLPPHSRDLDLIVRPEDEGAVADRLRTEGFHQNGGEWVRFRSCGAEPVDLIPARDWELPDAELEALFEDAIPLPGFERLARPAPHHLLLMLSRRLIQGDGRLDEKRRARIERALEDDPSAWEGASQYAPRWGMTRGLAALRAAYERGERLSARGRAEALAERFTAMGMNPRRAHAKAWKRVARPPGEGGGFLIAFSGLDGAGKSSQAEALKSALEQLGYETTLEWTRLEWTTLWEGGGVLGKIAWPVMRAVALVERVRGRGWAPAEPQDRDWYTDTVETPAARFRQRVGLVNDAWVTVVAAMHARAQRQATAPLIRAGRAVVCDRYTLDAAAMLRFRYGDDRRFRSAIRVLQRLSPQPLRAYHVDVPAAVAHARKAEQYSLDELERQARLYREERDALGVRVLDGERPREELCTEVALDVWRALRRI
jgi:thymidylate kinase